MKIDPDKEIQIACIDLVREMSYYGYILMQMPKVADDSVGTLAVAKKPEELLVKLLYSRSYIESLYEDKDFNTRIKADKHLLEVMKHEMLHVCLYHFSIRLQDRHRQAVACELEANSYINRAALLDGNKGLFPEDFGFQPKKSAIWYYDNLPSSEEYVKMKKKDEGFAAALLAAVKADASGQLDSHKTWELAASDPAINDTIKDLVKKAVQIASDSGQGFGNIPGSMLEAVSKDLHPAVIPWKRVLHNFIASSSESVLGFTLRRKSRRFGTRPGSYKQDTLHCLVGIDTSASISPKQLSVFFNELRWMSKDELVSLDVAECDTLVRRVYPFCKFDGNVKGRGGTDLEPLLKLAAEGKYDCLVCFTDFEAPKIEKDYHVPVLWCISGGSRFFKDTGARCYSHGIFIDVDKALASGT